ncbi:nuclear transport factor 2 family protein [Halioxenophilus sp. WMMB6]|uniref:nuclear transport factor 2 family protein n=1 Tax=Halioxenophilus sp. WMMB6 TaxID=3073815 RepID=UPI00295F1EBB|nr:nuclear transport factor 2 family protein [Halioxenophilus sp. WMMB6]
MNKGSVEDRLEIRELIEQFANAAMVINVEKWGDTWANEGTWNLPSFKTPVSGKANVIAAFAEKMAYVDYMSMISVPDSLQIEGNKASCQTFCRELIYPKAGGRVIVVGYFDDEFIKEDGRWKFLSRFYTVMGKEL